MSKTLIELMLEAEVNSTLNALERPALTRETRCVLDDHLAILLEMVRKQIGDEPNEGSKSSE